ncbi:hypothetical protein ONA91_17255 [Micromonospora sp. DR5-3]|uniref:hypothetical protein n=1 Tax=unclassified Micromonospora TaxID=2617518 RepID=UPI0011D85E30|nr:MULTISPECIES: hypothetical protein [unclassified Micromonospora]MCW3816194.1 hypothetical protein [Micromonospora sp. DR5-3]TYC19160.1 hypothetical protein FXF52_38060 [Micromonospora sp. MP36]
MSAGNKWWGRLAAVLGAVVFSVFVPVAAWASTATGERAVEAVARRPRGGAGLVCCLVVIFVAVLLVLWLVRRRRGRPR